MSVVNGERLVERKGTRVTVSQPFLTSSLYSHRFPFLTPYASQRGARNERYAIAAGGVGKRRASEEREGSPPGVERVGRGPSLT